MNARRLALLFLLVIGMAACVLSPRPVFRLVAGSGFSSYEPLLTSFAARNHVDLRITYKGSLDIMRMLQDGSIADDAIWDADSLWTSLGDRQRLIRHQKSIACSPIVFGLKQSRAAALGWVGNGTVRMQDILHAAETRKLRIMMTNATQSNSGASAYFGFLYAFAGNPDVLTAGHLEQPGLRDGVKRILGTIDRTSESSGFLRDLFVRDADRYDGMFNYESHVLAANQALVTAGREPLHLVYPVEGLGIADFPLSFVSRDNADREPVFLALQQFLLSADSQRAIASNGRRVGPLCDTLDPAIARPEWGVDASRTLNALKLPVAPVIWQALTLYQTLLRKPSFTVYCLDFSGSMAGKGEAQLKRAMRTLLDQREAATYLLQAGPDDLTVVITFDDKTANLDTIAKEWTVRGDAAGEFSRVLGRIEGTHTGNGTNIYGPVAQALRLMRTHGTDGRSPAIIVMTDGQSNVGALEDVKRAMADTGLSTVPVFGITFGDARKQQLTELAGLTGGRVFDGTKDLLTAFRNARGNN